MDLINAAPPSARAESEERMKRRVTCSDCSTITEEDEPGVDVPPRCNACGSANCRAVIIASSVVTIRGGVKGHLFSPDYKGGKKKAEEFFLGADIRRATGEFVEKVRIIDRLNDRYVEKITDDAGVVLHHEDEPLSEHWGHGSAKFGAGKDRQKGKSS